MALLNELISYHYLNFRHQGKVYTSAIHWFRSYRICDGTLELVGGISSNLFNVTVTPSEQLPVSAEGNSVMCMIMC